MIQKIKNYYHLLLAVAANVLYGFASKKLKVIGVTGTDGKTTTTNLIYHILKSANYDVSMVSTVGASIGGKMHDVGFHVTTPSPFDIQKYIKKAIDSGSKYLVLETTSHALDQNRVWGIDFEVGVLTNVTHEHLDYHKTYDRYLGAKIKLLSNSKLAILNRDDASYDQISSKFPTSPRLRGAGKVRSEELQFKVKKLVTYGLGKGADVNPKTFPFKTKLFGRFNQYNSLAAIAACKSLGVTDEDIRKGIQTFKPPIGRQQIVFDGDYRVMVDFAHTPNAFEVLLPEIRAETRGRLIHVFGSAGERDQTKRPKMGEVSSRFADIIILTAEDPRTERIGDINRQILSGIKNSKQTQNLKLKTQNNEKVIEIPDRKEAIKFAVSIARKGDIVVITGKGHEKSMNYGRGEEDWDEFEAVKSALKKEGNL